MTSPLPSFSAPPLLEGGVEEIAPRYDALICDVWGVIYNGERAIEVAADCLREWRARGKYVVLLSNAPRRSGSMAEQLGLNGLDSSYYDDLVTSGEATWRLLHGEGGGAQLEAPIYYIGPEGSGLREEFLVGIETTESIEEAGSLLIAGARGDYWNTQIGDGLLERAAARGLTALCSNPDLRVRRGNRIEPCAGMTAGEYEALGGRVLYVGKPHRPVYEICLRILSEHGCGRALAVGDGLPTDIRGAQELGMDSIFVASGVYDISLERRDESAEILSRLMREHGVNPTWWLPELSWGAPRF